MSKEYRRGCTAADQCRRKPECQPSKRVSAFFSSFGFCHSFVIRYSSFIISSRHHHANCRPASKLAFGFEATAVQLDDMFHNRQPKASSTELAATGFVGTIEALKNPGQIIFPDPNAIVGHADRNFMAALHGLDVDLSIFTRI